MMGIPKGSKANFETLKQAFAHGDVCLMEVLDTKTGEVVDAICAVQKNGDEVETVPFAIMLRENPYERLAPPKPEGGFEMGSIKPPKKPWKG